jgi:hypothetical protein
MNGVHLIQSRELFGPPARQEELQMVWAANSTLFDEYTHPEGRPTFTQLLTLCKPDHTNIILNSDCYFDAEGVALIRAWGEAQSTTTEQRQILALSRWDVMEDGTAKHWMHVDSQDCWIIHGGPLDINIPWPLGFPGIDNRVAHELHEAGFNVRNPSLTIKCYHRHLISWRSYLSEENSRPRMPRAIDPVPPPYRRLSISTL